MSSAVAERPTATEATNLADLSGTPLIDVEGEAHKVTDGSTVAAMAERWAAGGWPARVDDTGLALTAEYSAPSAGAPPWFVYRLAPNAATALLTAEPGGATRWRL